MRDRESERQTEREREGGGGGGGKEKSIKKVHVCMRKIIQAEHIFMDGCRNNFD